MSDDRDRLVFEAGRHYLAAIALVAFAAAIVATIVHLVRPHAVEVTTLVVEKGNRIGSLQQGTLSQVVFHSSTVYVPAMKALGLNESPQRLYEDVELRPVPGANALLVAGRDSDPQQAARLSEVMARALSAAYADRGFTFSVVGSPGPSALAVGLTLPVTVGLAAMSGFWLALGIALVHYRVRRPVLSLRRAVDLSAPERIALLPSGGRSWLGALSRTRWRDAEQRALRRMAQGLPQPCRVTVVAPRRIAGRADRTAVPWIQQEPHGSSSRVRRPVRHWTVLVVGPGTPEAELDQILAMEGGRHSVALAWMR
jgi:hypothetical protein